jgi:hypothetical protein
MNYKAIPIDGYYFIVSDEECKRFLQQKIIDGNYYPINVIAIEEKAKDKYPGLPLFDAPSEWGEDVEKIADEIYNKNNYGLHKSSIVDIVNQYKARSKYKWTDEDMEKAFDIGRKQGYVDYGFKHFLQSLQKPKSYQVILEMEADEWIPELGVSDPITWKPKITNNKLNILSWKEL